MLVKYIGKWEGGCTKKEFVDKVLKEKVKEDTKGLAKYIDDILKDPSNSEGRFDYGEKKVRLVLLLHNVLTYLKRLQVAGEQYDTLSPIRFPFNLYKREDWDVEHIASQSGDNLDSPGSINEWLASICWTLYTRMDNHLKDSDSNSREEQTINIDIEELKRSEEEKSEVIGHIITYLQSKENEKENKEALDGIKTDIQGWLYKEGEARNSLDNLVLLDKNTNRAYKNAVFPLKRRWILSKERGEKVEPLTVKIEEDKLQVELKPSKKGSSSYILPCTKDVFTKSYNEHMDHGLEWTREDGKSYLKRMKEIFDHFGLLNEEQN